MSQSSEAAASGKNNIVRVRASIRGTRPLLQHEFGEDSIPLDEGEKTGVAGNDPEEWKKTCMVTADGALYVRGDYIFSMIRNAGKYTKKGRGTLMGLIAATLQVEEGVVLLGRHMPEGGPAKKDFAAPVYVDVRPVRNPKTKGRNIRYRLACSPGWTATFTILWDKTVVSRPEMRAVLQDAAVLCGLGDGLGIGMGRFEVTQWEELSGAEEAAAEGTVGAEEGTRLEPGRKKVRPVREAATADGVSH